MNRLQLEEAVIPVTVPVIEGSVCTNTTTTVQPTSILQYTKDVLTKFLCHIKELPNNNKGNSNVSAEYDVQMWWRKLKSRYPDGNPGHKSPTHTTSMLQVLTIVIDTISLLATLSHQELYTMCTLLWYKLKPIHVISSTS